MLLAPVQLSLTEEQASRFTGFPVALPVFEGPLDLLLYLIKRQEIDIFDIPIARVAGQFLDYLALLEAMDIEVAADFLVMAATLLEIKSRMLLPRPPALLEEDVEEEEDPRAELVRKLLEYQQYKSAAGELQKLAEEQKLRYSRASIIPNIQFARPEPSLAESTDSFRLWMALQEVLARVEQNGPTVREVARPAITIRKQMIFIIKLLESSPSGVEFTRLFINDERAFPLTRIEVIITFLAMLELMRLRRIEVGQEELFGEMRIVSVAVEMPLAS